MSPARRRQRDESDGTDRPDKPAATKPAKQRPATKKSATKKPSMKKPGKKRPNGGPPADQPGPSQPGKRRPGKIRPGTKPPGTQPPGTKPPGTKPPGTKPPRSKPPGTKPPGTKPPGTKPPGTKPPGTRDPGAGIPGTGIPGTDVPGPIDDLPIDIGGGPRFTALNKNLPLALLPIQLTTRFHRPAGPGTTPTELRVRISPDPLFADDHSDRLTETETQLGHAYWRHRWGVGTDATEIAAADRWLVDQLDLGRAMWVVRQTTPKNMDDLGRGAPSFPKRKLQDAPIPPVAELLPDRWVAATYRNNEFRGAFWSKRVIRELPLVVAPQLVDMPDGSSARDFLDRQDLDWRHDYDRALDVGMAITIPLDDETSVYGLSDLIVFGVNERDRSLAFERLLDHHRYSEGLDFVPQGTATNNTDTVASGSKFSVEAAFAGDRLDDSTTSAAADLSKDPSTLFRTRAADAAATALGVPTGSPLARAEHADLLELEHAAAMNKAVWPATVARVMQEILATRSNGGRDPVSALAAGDLRWLRDHFVRYVRGAAVLPALRVGDQPYGLLPVTRMPGYVERSGATDEITTLSEIIADLGIAWASARSGVATMSPLDDGPVPGATPADEAIEVAAVLGAVPHPTAFRLRAAIDERDSITGDWVSAVNEMDLLLRNMPRTDAEVADDGRLYYTSVEQQDGTAFVYSEYLDEYDAIYDGSVLSQFNALTRFREWLNVESNYLAYGPPGGNPMLGLGLHIGTYVLPLLGPHDLRAADRDTVTNPRHDIGFDSGASLPTDTDPDLFYTVYEDPDEEPPRLRIVDAGNDTALADLLTDRIEILDRKSDGSVPTFNWTEERSLLTALIDQSIDAVATTSIPVMRDGLVRLRTAVENSEFDRDDNDNSTRDALARMLRETLGLLTHRHDAWHASVAAHRLAEVRAKRPTGLNVGAYGWLIDVRPDDGTPDTQGFIHAPSLDHAATAAVLRSAWSNLTSSLSHEPFSIDLSSDRVRRARWLLAGMRNGQDLGELLGQRLERRLHDAELDAHIDDIRRVVLDESGFPGRPTHSIVDGVHVADAYAGSDTGAVMFGALEDLRTAAPSGERQALLDAFKDTTADLDATNDLLMADSVHNLVRGNLDGVAASLSVSGSNPGGLPDPRVADIKRSALVVTHRVCALLANNDAPVGPAEIANPDVAAWVASMLPPMKSLVVHGRLVDESGTVATESVTVADLGLTPLAFVELSSARVTPDTSRLAQLCAAWFTARWARPEGTIELELGLDDLDDAFVVAGALREALGHARPMTGSDLSNDDDSAAIDVKDAQRRSHRLATELTALAASATSVETVRQRAGDFASVDVGRTIAALSARTEQAAAVLQDLSESVIIRTKALNRAPDADAANVPAALQESLGAAVDLSGKVALRFTPDEGSVQQFDDGEQRIDDPRRARRWILATSRVQPGVGKLHDAVTLAEAVRNENLLVPGVAQLADVAGHDDGWAALDLPAPEAGRSRMCIFSITDPAPARATTAMAGLLFDAWSEPIPGSEVTTGVAVHFDSPTSRAPQAILLMTPPPGESWSHELVRETIKQTLEVAQQRAIGPETLGSHGMILPAVFLAEDTVVSEQAGVPWVDLIDGPIDGGGRSPRKKAAPKRTGGRRPRQGRRTERGGQQ